MTGLFFIKSIGNFIFHVSKSKKVKRRQAIRHLGVGFSSALVGTSWLSSCSKGDPGPEIQYDGNVIVIGAGPAGLLAADILSTAGINVMVLEATAQAGGRVHSLSNQEGLVYQSIADFPLELGAEYFQGADSLMGKIASNLSLITVQLPKETRKYAMGNVVKSAAEWTGNAEFEAAQAFVDGIKTYTGPAVTVQGVAGGFSEDVQELINGQVGNFYGSSNEKVGIKGISEQLKIVDHDEEYYVLKSHPMQDVLATRFYNLRDKIQFNSPVKSINYSAEPVTITLEDGTQFTANKVVVTVPVTILKNGITFAPALPAAKISALNRIGMDPSIRVILDFKKNFWGETSSFTWGGTLAPQVFNAGMARSEFMTTLTITVNGPKALELSNLPNNDAIVDAVIAELDARYEGHASEFIRRELPTEADPRPYEQQERIAFVKDWTKAPYAKGGFSYPLANTTLDDRTTLFEPIGGRLFFAGEATDISGEPGTVNGAFASAERVAEDVKQSILRVS